jgi:electron transfer flavoprotein beta subunit
MNLLVCIGKTPETTSKISFTDNNTAFSTDGVQYIMNPYDEWYALVRALELKEAAGGTVTVINVGPAANDVIIRKALAIGADEAVRIDAEPDSALFVAKQIAKYAQDKSYDLILTGKETIDYSGALVGPMIAELLGLPFMSHASHMDIADGKATVTCDIEGGVEVISSSLPIVVSASKGLAEQRIPNMKGIMMAKRKPLNVEAAQAIDDRVKIKSYKLPAEKSGVKLVDAENMDELVRLLHEEAKVL